MSTEKSIEAAASPILDLPSRLLGAVSGVIRGKEAFLEKVLAAYAAGGHILLEDKPGTGKTTVGRVLSRLADGSEFKRIQFTPDLLPYDITGVDIWDDVAREFSFRPGPLFANVVLADEINRSTPKVQSALLEAMAESQVTVGGVTRALPNPFLVLATQNPIETEGTFILPEAQKDRFMVRLSPGYPDEEQEYGIVREDPSHTALPALKPVTDIDEIRSLRSAARSVHVDDRLVRCAVDIARASREHPDVFLGVSTRGALMLVAVMRGLAVMRGRDYVIDQDLADLAVDAYAHRLRMKGGGLNPENLIADLAAKEIRNIRHG